MTYIIQIVIIDKEVISLDNSIRTFEKSKNKNLSDLRTKYLNKIRKLELRYKSFLDADRNLFADYLWNIYDDYEKLLNNMNSELKIYLNNNKLNTLKQLPNKWIKDKKKEEDHFNKVLLGTLGASALIAEPNLYIDAINKHCYDVINTLMY